MKIVVVGATDVGKTTIIRGLCKWFLENNLKNETEFIEVSWPPPPILRHRRFSSKRVAVGVIVTEPNRYSLIFLNTIYNAFSPHTPKIIVMNKIDTVVPLRGGGCDTEIELYENFCASHSCDVLKICAFADDISTVCDKIYKYCIVQPPAPRPHKNDEHNTRNDSALHKNS